MSDDANGHGDGGHGEGDGHGEGGRKPSEAQRRYLRRGLDQPGGKLPLFDTDGKAVTPATVRACIDRGWAEPWFANPTKPDWLVCKLTASGYRVLDAPVPDHAGGG